MKLSDGISRTSLSGTEKIPATISGDSSNYNIPIRSFIPGAWTTHTPTVTASSGTITSYTATARYCQIGSVVFYRVKVVLTNIGTSSGSLQITLPVNAEYSSLGYQIISGISYQGSNKAAKGVLTNTQILASNYDATYFSSGDTIILEGFYEAA